jgi:hypothetical protein
MTIQATRTRSRLAEHDGFSCPHERMVSRVDTDHHLRSHARGVGDPSGTPHAGKPGRANTVGLPCGHTRKCKHHPAHQSPAPHPCLKKRSADIEVSDFRQVSISRVNERPQSTGVSKVFPGKRRLKLSRGETLYFRWTQFGIQSLRGCLFLLFGSTLVVKIKKTQESTPSV